MLATFASLFFSRPLSFLVVGRRSSFFFFFIVLLLLLCRFAQNGAAVHTFDVLGTLQ